MWNYYYNYDETNDYLCHYGVLGMKWGKRKARSTLLPGGVPKRSNPKRHDSGQRMLTKTTMKYHQAAAQIQKKKAQTIKGERDDIIKSRKEMLELKNANGKPLFTEKDVDDIISGLDRIYKKADNAAKKHERSATQLKKAAEQYADPNDHPFNEKPHKTNYHI